MIVFLTLLYVGVLFVLIKLKVLPNTTGVWLTTIVWVVVLFVFLLIPMQWGAPTGPIRIMTRVVQVIPNVSGQVIEIAAVPNVPMQKGDLLFQIDPVPFQQSVELASASLVRAKAQSGQDFEALESASAKLRQTLSQQVLAQARFDDDEKLVQRGVIAANRLERRQANLDAARAAVDAAQAAVASEKVELSAVTEAGVIAKVAEAETRLEQAQWNLDQTRVTAPGDGFVTNLALTEGQRITNMPFAPAMAFVDTSEKVLIAEIHQIYLRHVEPGQPVEITMKTMPGQLMTGTVDVIIPAASQGQALVSGTLAASGAIQAEPFLIRIAMDDPAMLDGLLPGSVGDVAIYTNSVAATHVIRKVMIRMTAILNYLNPAL